MQVQQITLDGQQHYDDAGGVFPLIYTPLAASTATPLMRIILRGISRATSRQQNAG